MKKDPMYFASDVLILAVLVGLFSCEPVKKSMRAMGENEVEDITAASGSLPDARFYRTSSDSAAYTITISPDERLQTYRDASEKTKAVQQDYIQLYKIVLEPTYRRAVFLIACSGYSTVGIRLGGFFEIAAEFDYTGKRGRSVLEAIKTQRKYSLDAPHYVLCLCRCTFATEAEVWAVMRKHEEGKKLMLSLQLTYTNAHEVGCEQGRVRGVTHRFSWNLSNSM